MPGQSLEVTLRVPERTLPCPESAVSQAADGPGASPADTLDPARV